jgi:hypothetical protein
MPLIDPYKAKNEAPKGLFDPYKSVEKPEGDQGTPLPPTKMDTIKQVGGEFITGAKRGLASLVGGIGQRVGMVSQPDMDAAQLAMQQERQNEGFAGKAGEFVGNVAPTFLIPGGGAKTVLGKVATSIGQGGVIGALQPTAKNESAAKNIAVGAVTGGGTSLALSGLKKLAPIVGRVAKETLGMTTGAGTGAIEEGLRGSEAFKNALRGKITGDEVVNHAKTALNVIKDKRGAAYRQKLEEVTANKSPIDLTEIKTAVTNKLKNFVKYTETKATPQAAKAAEEFKVVPYPQGSGFALMDSKGTYFTGRGGHAEYFKSEELAQGASNYMKENASKAAKKAEEYANRPNATEAKFNWSRTTVGDIKNSKDAKELKQIYDKIQNWGSQQGDNTAVELDRLRRDLDNHWSDSSRVRAFVQHAKETVDKAIKKNVPEYTDMTKGYAEATSLIKDIESGLMLKKTGLSGRIVADQTLRRLTSSMKENFELRRDLVEALGKQGGNDIAGEVAGYSMNQVWPKGVIRQVGAAGAGQALFYLNPKMMPILAASSPRTVGEFLIVFEKASNQLSKMGKVVPENILPKVAATQATQSNPLDTTTSEQENSKAIQIRKGTQ